MTVSPKNIMYAKGILKTTLEQISFLVYSTLIGTLVTELHKGNPNHSFNTLQVNINSALDKYMPLKNCLWITIGIRKSIERREYVYKFFYKSQEYWNQGRIP